MTLNIAAIGRRIGFVALAVGALGMAVYFMAIAAMFGSCSLCDDVNARGAILHFRERRAQFDALSALVSSKLAKRGLYLDDESIGCTPRWAEFSIRLGLMVDTGFVEALNERGLCESSAQLTQGFERVGLDAVNVQHLIALVRGAECMAVYYDGEPPIRFLFREQGFGAFWFLRYDHVSIEGMRNEMRRSGTWKVDERTLVRYVGGL